MAWATLEQVLARWEDAPTDEDLLTEQLEAVHEVCVEYAPTLRAGDPVPQRYVEAEVLQLRSLWQAWQRDGDVLGFGDGFAVRVRPLGEDVKALLRPRRGKPRVR
jgi:hypothetical protein